MKLSFFYKFIFLLSIFSIFINIQSCTKNNKNEWDYAIAPNNYEVQGKIDNSLNLEHVATSKYNSFKELNYLSNIDTEKDFQKYYKKYSLFEKNLDFEEKKESLDKYQFIKEFINNGNSLEDAYKTILYFYKQRENLNYVDFSLYCNPYFGDYENSEFEDDCASTYNEASELYRLTNLSLLKARRIILDIINNQMKENVNLEETEMAYTMVILSYLGQDRLYNLSDIQKYSKIIMKNRLNNSEKNKRKKFEIEIFFDNKENKKIENLINYIGNVSEFTLVDIMKKAKNEKFLDLIFSTNGYYNYLNDNYYTPVAIIKRGERFAINAYYPQYFQYKIIPEIMKKIIPENVKMNFKNSYYDFQNNLDILFNNEHFIFPYDGVIFVVEMKDNNFHKIKVFNPKLYDLNYPNMNSNISEISGMPRIMNEYNYKVNNSDFINFENGKYFINQNSDENDNVYFDDNKSESCLWNNVADDLKIDKNVFFKLGDGINCFDSSSRINDKICGNRELMIIMKYIQMKECYNKSECKINPAEINKYLKKKISNY